MNDSGKARAGLMVISMLAAACGSKELETRPGEASDRDLSDAVASQGTKLDAPAVKRLPISDADAERLLKARVDRNARIDQLKDSAEKAATPAARTQAIAEAARLTTEAFTDTPGHLEVGETPPAREPEQLSPEQQTKMNRLLARMAQFDMKDPVQAAEWNRVKHEEFEK